MKNAAWLFILTLYETDISCPNVGSLGASVRSNKGALPRFHLSVSTALLQAENGMVSCVAASLAYESAEEGHSCIPVCMFPWSGSS